MKEKHEFKMRDELRKRRDYYCKALNEIEGISCVMPEGAFYVFPRIEGIGKRWKSDKAFVLDLLEKEGVLFVHGSGFDAYGENHFRSTFLPPVPILEEVIEKLERFMQKD